MFVVVVIPVVLACLFLVFLLVRKAGNGGAAPRVRNADDTKLIQEIHKGLLKMEQRIEALETIVLESGERSEA
jgi:phage shock protein B